MKKRTIRIDNICFRWTKSLGSEPRDYPEIVKFYFDDHFKKEMCYTLASWTQGKEDWTLEFCGERPFTLEKDEQEIFWKLAKEGHELINAWNN